MADRLEGSPASQFVQLMKEVGFNDFDSIHLATVTSDPPALKIQVDGMKIELESDDIIVAERLTAHTRKATISTADVSGQQPKDGPPFTALDIHDITLTEATVQFTDELKVGDRVIVSSMNNGQTYVILDKAVQYGA